MYVFFQNMWGWWLWSIPSPTPAQIVPLLAVFQKTEYTAHSMKRWDGIVLLGQFATWSLASVEVILGPIHTFSKVVINWITVWCLKLLSNTIQLITEKYMACLDDVYSGFDLLSARKKCIEKIKYTLVNKYFGIIGIFHSASPPPGGCRWWWSAWRAGSSSTGSPPGSDGKHAPRREAFSFLSILLVRQLY